MLKNIEITRLIDIKICAQPIRYVDLLGNMYSIDSYEKYIQEFSLIKNLFKEKIPEFSNLAEKQLNIMSDFITDCDKENEENAKIFINKYFESRLNDYRYNGEILLELIFIEGLNNETAYSIETLVQIYKELGYNNLKIYIELLKNPSLLNSYLSDSAKQNVAMHYILFKTNHHSTQRFRRNNTALNLYKIMENNINDSINEITKQKDDFINFMNVEKQGYLDFKNNEKNEFDEWFSKSNNDYSEFMKECQNNIARIEKTYSEKLKIEEPSKFMKEKANDYRKKTKFWGFIIVCCAIILLVLLGLILNPTIVLNKRIITINLFNNEMPIYSSIIILSMICLIIYVIRVFIKIMLSSKHLSEEYQQKYVLTYFYLSLINSGNIDDKVGNIILSTLFTKIDTGLIKGDNNEYDSLIKMLTSVGK